jgi:hypothetical protein
VAERPLSRARAGGEQAFRELVDPYRGKLHGPERVPRIRRGELRGADPVRISMRGITPSTITSPAPGPGSWTGYRDLATVVVGRRLFDVTNGWGGKAAAGEDVFVATHQPPTDWEHADTAPFTFVDGVERRLPPPRSSPGTGTSTWPPVRSAARRSNSG